MRSVTIKFIIELLHTGSLAIPHNHVADFLQVLNFFEIDFKKSYESVRRQQFLRVSLSHDLENLKLSQIPESLVDEKDAERVKPVTTWQQLDPSKIAQHELPRSKLENYILRPGIKLQELDIPEFIRKYPEVSKIKLPTLSETTVSLSVTPGVTDGIEKKHLN